MSIASRVMLMFFGLPVTAFILFLAVHGLVLGYGGIIKGQIVMILMGLLTVTGLIGVFGAWLRVLTLPKSLSFIKVINLMLGVGIATCLVLCGWMLWEGFGPFPLAPLLLAGVGVELFINTPSPNKAINKD